MSKKKNITPKKKKMAPPPLGAHLKYDGAFGISALTHHAIFVGKNKVVHFTGGHDEWDPRAAAVKKEPFKKFEKAAKGKYQIVPHPDSPYSAKQIVKRAEKLVGLKGYNVLTNNCEHLANFVVTGKSESPQVAQMLGKLMDMTKNAAWFKKNMARYQTAARMVEGLAYFAVHNYTETAVSYAGHDLVNALKRRLRSPGSLSETDLLAKAKTFAGSLTGGGPILRRRMARHFNNIALRVGIAALVFVIRILIAVMIGHARNAILLTIEQSETLKSIRRFASMAHKAQQPNNTAASAVSQAGSVVGKQAYDILSSWMTGGDLRRLHAGILQLESSAGTREVAARRMFNRGVLSESYRRTRQKTN